jgi:inosine/xanthosine triphosphate pyrophosphatase family protein
MKKKFVFATNNAHKLEEVTAILGDKIELLSMKDIHCSADIPETADTLEGNALLKARYIFENYHLDCFADDTGLEVEALNGAPGVYSARYAGDAQFRSQYAEAVAGYGRNGEPKSPIPYRFRTYRQWKGTLVRRHRKRRNNEAQARYFRFRI